VRVMVLSMSWRVLLTREGESSAELSAASLQLSAWRETLLRLRGHRDIDDESSAEPSATSLQPSARYRRFSRRADSCWLAADGSRLDSSSMSRWLLGAPKRIELTAD